MSGYTDWERACDWTPDGLTRTCDTFEDGILLRTDLDQWDTLDRLVFSSVTQADGTLLEQHQHTWDAHGVLRERFHFVDYNDPDNPRQDDSTLDRWDAQGLLVYHMEDWGPDGLMDAEERWTYDRAGVETYHYSYINGYHSLTERVQWSADGSRRATGQGTLYGTPVTYTTRHDPTGVLLEQHQDFGPLQLGTWFDHKGQMLQASIAAPELALDATFPVLDQDRGPGWVAWNTEGNLQLSRLASNSTYYDLGLADRNPWAYIWCQDTTWFRSGQIKTITCDTPETDSTKEYYQDGLLRSELAALGYNCATRESHAALDARSTYLLNITNCGLDDSGYDITCENSSRRIEWTCPD
ncbi:MAG: hypothetical protein JXX28_15885 [Deltaproteobacteria bacterium]|nr:hypothetical protein [Deltaproteobacteria bacterium]